MPSAQKTRVVPKVNTSPSGARAVLEATTLSIDIGGSSIKAALVNGQGKFVKERIRIPTPKAATPDIMIRQLEQLSKRLGPFDRLAVGFPGVVRHGITRVAPNLALEWKGYDFAKALAEKFSKPVRVMNDADMQGFGAISGQGVELVVTLGTGVGTALFADGTLVPNVEAGEDSLSGRALKKVGIKRWNKRLVKYIRRLEGVFNYDKLYIGGGNAKHVHIQNLPGNVTICSNLKALLGGARMWKR